ncbi:transglutaminase-like cysteine peptidase [Aestuariivirga litoralis]|uniref:transglutaminase-like cysteine peptidase n=1 Tax=Aestuariivirga litoralis TaxID=2650924 RepID=UPI0018C4F5CE|nr:transglutaminase-like cysteine peptidase [Aestuariivirga litoralis]MBG1231296.1 transglutaminase-like cysteine peptidase [Aestuariivirga litoralis]
MKINTVLGTILTSLVLGFAPAHSAALKGNFEKPTAAPAATVYGSTLPPAGYVAFCGRGEDECKFTGGTNERVALTNANWAEINKVNHYVNTKIRPATDQELYGMADYWTYPVDAGDCEDFVLLKKRYFEQLGYNPDQLLITVVLDENGDGHAVMTIPTDKGDLVLDNRRQDILRWNETGYIFLKRQSQAASNIWVSLQKGPSQTVSSNLFVSTKGN